MATVTITAQFNEEEAPSYEDTVDSLIELGYESIVIEHDELLEA